MYPTEVVFEDNQRSAEITLSNSGDQTGTFEMGWTHMTMTPEGGNFVALFEVAGIQPTLESIQNNVFSPSARAVTRVRPAA